MGNLIIKNAYWLTPQGSFDQGSILISEGKIVSLNKTQIKLADAEVHDASGYMILPGAIDPHVHFREPGQKYKEGIDNGSKAALAGGVTTVIDMPNNNPPCSTLRRIMQKKKLFSHKSHVNWGVMLHTSSRIEKNLADKIISAKVYMAKSSRLPAITDVKTIIRIMRNFPVISFHAEDESLLDISPQRSPLHHENRPRQAVISALNKIEQAFNSLPEKDRPRIVICHMNTTEEMAWIKKKKTEGWDIFGETCPHYLFFTQDDYIAGGAVFQVNPPIRTREDQKALHRSLGDGTIDFIGTDHAPHASAEKASAKPPSGIASIEWLLPQILYLIDKNIINWKKFHELTVANAARCYGIALRNGIIEGNYADLVFVKRVEQKDKIRKIQSKTGINLYEKFDFKWRVCRTFVNGILKYDGKKYFEKGKGKEVK